MSVRTALLGEVCDINPRAPKGLADDLQVSFLPMAAVSEDGFIEFEEKRTFGEVRKGYTHFERDDVLLAKITPCFENGKATRTNRLQRQTGFGSTEFHVIRASADADPNYIFHTVWNSSFRELGARNMTGSAGQKRVPADFLKRLPIPLPPLAEQRRIAAILDKADALRRKRKRALDLLDGLTQSIFLEMFGELQGPAAAYDTRPFGTLVADQKIGLVRSSKQLSSTPRGAPYLRMDAIGTDGVLRLHPCQYTSASEHDCREYALQEGDFLFNTRNSRELVGKTAIFRGSQDFLYNNNILRVRFIKEVIPEYILGYFRTPLAKRELENRKAGTTSVVAIYQKSLETLPVVLPSLDRQQTYAKRMACVARLRQKLLELAKQDDSLFASLQSRAFSGQL